LKFLQCDGYNKRINIQTVLKDQQDRSQLQILRCGHGEKPYRDPLRQKTFLADSIRSDKQYKLQ